MTVETFVEDAPNNSVIVSWAGDVANIPPGWILCDGNNGTPDMRGRFVSQTASGSDQPGSTLGLGSFTISTSQMPQHNHPTSSDTPGSHQHGMNDFGNEFDYSADNSVSAIDNGQYRDGTKSTSGSGSHQHSAPSINNAGSGSLVDNNPSYYEVAFLMKA